jgi:hypothetical protein
MTMPVIRLRGLIRSSSRVTLPLYFLLPVLVLVVLSQTSCMPRMFEDLSARTLKNKMDSGTKMVIVDLRTSREYLEGHVPTAINVPPDKLYSLREVLPKDKSTLIVFYCRGYS